MGATAFTVGGFQVTWAALLALVGVVQWLVFVAMSAMSREEFFSGLRSAEKKLLASSGVLLVLWLVAFDVTSLFGSSAKASEASAASYKTPKASCATIETGMREAQVREKLGDPDETRPEEETRGPGATTMLYKGSRCAVHLFDGKVEFID